MKSIFNSPNIKIIFKIYLLYLTTGRKGEEEWRQQWKPNHVILNEKRKHIDVDTRWLNREYKEKTGQTLQKVGLDINNKEKAIIDLITEQKQLSAYSHGNVAIAETNIPGQKAQAQKFGDKGGIAQVEGHSGQLRVKEDGEGKHALLKADGHYELDTLSKGGNESKNGEKEEFQARNDRFDFRLTPAEQNEKQGHGLLSYGDNEKGKKGAYEYAIVHKDKNHVEAQLSAKDTYSNKNDILGSLFGRRSEKYFCKAETPGVSQCYDAQGRSAGKVVADKSGNAVVYNEKDVPIGTGSVRKVSERNYEAVISKNLFITRLKDARRGPCCKEFTGYDCVEQIKLSNPQFSHPESRDENGNVYLTWPECFDMSIDVTLPPNVHINRLAMKLDVHIQPIGKLRCMDVATCGRECYYCDWCRGSRKLKLLERTDGNLCRATEERTYRLTTKLCPPPEDPNFTLCTTFSKSVWQKDYWQKEGALDIWMKFYERAENRQELEQEFFSQLDNPLLGKAFKLAIIGEWLAANSLDQGSYTPTNSELIEFWVSRRAPDRLLACDHAVIDYELEGSKVKTNVLFEAATTAGNLPNIFKDKKCQQFEHLQENRFQQGVREYKQKNGGSSGNILSGLGNLFRG
ncbi:hypothetical protein Mgra_00002493 [Meloidogyne graminicola]|uniref:Uncharacterized protein n=1 Tax=Meloidogyne graminicola TaxID=189291 RepID=A0A8S9ZXU0_9BILA|nr:hypothetical protein Mgra_00002493 [Meloidogyne graminicola]